VRMKTLEKKRKELVADETDKRASLSIDLQCLEVLNEAAESM